MFFDGIDIEKSDIAEHPEVLKYFKTKMLCEKRYRDIVVQSQNRILNLKDRAKTLEVDFSKIQFYANLFKDWSTEDLYNVVLKAVDNDYSFIRFKNFVIECFDTIKDIRLKKSEVQKQNKKDKNLANQELRHKNIKIGYVEESYKMMKRKLNFYLKYNINPNDNDLDEYKFLNSFIDIYTQKNVNDYNEELKNPKQKHMPLERIFNEVSSKNTGNNVAEQIENVNKRKELDLKKCMEIVNNLLEKNDESSNLS